MIEDVEPEVFHQLLRFILLPASLNGRDGDRRIWEKTKKKIQFTMLKSNPIKGAVMTSTWQESADLLNQILHLCIHDAINDTHNQQG